MVTVLVYQKSPFDEGVSPIAEIKSYSGINPKAKNKVRTSRELRGSERRRCPRRRF